MKLRLGALHVHSDFSDGEFKLAELRAIFLDLGCSFVCMTDHAEAFDAPRLAQYVADCGSLSDDRFRFIPGLEYNCEGRLHILGYGVTSLLSTTNPVEVIERINQLGGISVIAHPPDRAFNSIEEFGSALKGIEVWNSKYDGRYAPRPQTFELLKRMQQRTPGLRAYYGLDLHWKRQFRGLLVRIGSEGFESGAVLSVLSRGNYSGIWRDQELPSSGNLPAELMDRFAGIHARSSQFRNMAKSCKALLDRTGLRVPDSIKAQLRRFF